MKTSAESEQVQTQATVVRRQIAIAACVLVGLHAVVTKIGWVEKLIFLPERIAAGEWWRVITHPFIHVSWYHLLLDGAAFLVLYAGLSRYSRSAKLTFCVGAAIGSVMAAVAFAPLLPWTGLCGLSGVAHGLMAISGLDMLGREDRMTRCLGGFSLALVVAKSLFEAASGQVVLSALHFGMMGLPVAVCHIGGVIGGLIGFWLVGFSTAHALSVQDRWTPASRRRREPSRAHSTASGPAFAAGLRLGMRRGPPVHPTGRDLRALGLSVRGDGIHRP